MKTLPHLIGGKAVESAAASPVFNPANRRAESEGLFRRAAAEIAAAVKARQRRLSGLGRDHAAAPRQGDVRDAPAAAGPRR